MSSTILRTGILFYYMEFHLTVWTAVDQQLFSHVQTSIAYSLNVRNFKIRIWFQIPVFGRIRLQLRNIRTGALNSVVVEGVFFYPAMEENICN